MADKPSLRLAFQHAKFEGPDPDYWCHKGYAIVNYDPRGIGNSEGDIDLWSSQEGRDGYDLIEWLAQQEWCSGKIGMLGNSALAMAQWRIAPSSRRISPASRPGKATATSTARPSHGAGSPRTDSGRSSSDVGRQRRRRRLGHHGRRVSADERLLGGQDPSVREDRRPGVRDSRLEPLPPSRLHMGYMHISSKQKWLRAHREFEWPDQYSRLGLEEATLFFDRYLKGIRNGWE